MSVSLIRNVIELVGSGWRPYNYKPTPKAYENLHCPYADAKGKKKPFWFVRGDIFLCVSCERGCTLSRPEGFILPLPIRYEEHKATPFSRTPGEMVVKKSLLRVDEAAYCLNISERSVYDWIAEGKLRKARGAPIRVAAEDVAYFMTNFEE
jgi:excisionase family DNA binding protein